MLDLELGLDLDMDLVLDLDLDLDNTAAATTTNTNITTTTTSSSSPICHFFGSELQAQKQLGVLAPWVAVLAQMVKPLPHPHPPR